MLVELGRDRIAGGQEDMIVDAALDMLRSNQSAAGQPARQARGG